MKKLALIVCSILAGCSYNPTNVQIQIDNSFSPSRKEMILESLNDWAAKTNGGFGYSNVSYVDGISSDTEDNMIKFINQDVEEQPYSLHPDAGLKLLGYTNTEYSTFAHPTDHIEAVVYIWDGELDYLFQASSRHEIGHAVLINHYCTEEQGTHSYLDCEVVSTDPEPAIMYPGYSGFQVVEPVDVYRFCQRWGCPSNPTDAGPNDNGADVPRFIPVTDAATAS